MEMFVLSIIGITLALGGMMEYSLEIYCDSCWASSGEDTCLIVSMS